MTKESILFIEINFVSFTSLRLPISCVWKRNNLVTAAVLSKVMTSSRNCNYILFTKLPWPKDFEGFGLREGFRSSSQATTCEPHTVLYQSLNVIEYC